MPPFCLFPDTSNAPHACATSPSASERSPHRSTGASSAIPGRPGSISKHQNPFKRDVPRLKKKNTSTSILQAKTTLAPVISVVHKNLTSFHPSPLPKKETPEVTQPIFEPFCKVTKSSYPTKRTWEHHGTTNIAVATEISLTSTDGWIIATISINRHKGDHDLWHPPYHPPPLSLRPLHCASGFLFFPPLAFGSSSGGLPWDWDSCQPEKVSLQMQAHFVEIHEHYLIELSNMTLLLCTVHWNEFI